MLVWHESRDKEVELLIWAQQRSQGFWRLRMFAQNYAAGLGAAVNAWEFGKWAVAEGWISL